MENYYLGGAVLWLVLFFFGVAIYPPPTDEYGRVNGPKYVWELLVSSFALTVAIGCIVLITN